MYKCNSGFKSWSGQGLAALVLLSSVGLSYAEPLPYDVGLELRLVANDAVPLADGTVEVWPDSSGMGTNATQSSASARPLLVANGLNGHNIVRFDGSDDRLVLDVNLFSSTALPKTVFVVLSTDDVSGHVVGTGSSSPGFLPSFGAALTIAGRKALLKANSGSTGVALIAPETVIDGDAYVMSGVLGDAQSRLETNCTYAESGDALNAYPYGVTTIGATGTAVDAFGGDIAEIVVFDHALSEENVLAVRSHLEQKYGVTTIARTDSSGNGVFDGCENGEDFIDADLMAVSLGPETSALTGGTLENVSDRADSTEFDPHSGTTHVWVSGGVLDLLLEWPTPFRISKVHFWNYDNRQGNFDVDEVELTFFDSDLEEVGQFVFNPEPSQSPIFSEDVLMDFNPVASRVRARLTGTNTQADFQNIGFTGAPAARGTCNGLVVTVDIGTGEVPTSGDDVVLGTVGADEIDAGSGDDTVCAGGGADIVVGGPGNDTIEGEEGDDRIAGGPGNDVLNGGSGNDSVFGGNGSDNISGGDGDDTVAGQGGADTVSGDAGVDSVAGGPGPDLLNGGPGDDVLRGQGGGDLIDGGAGYDQIFGGSGNDVIATGPDGAAVIAGGNNDVITGSSAADDIQGNSGLDEIRGGGGNDVLNGGNGVDEVYGEGGADTLIGAAEPDRLFGGPGNDELRGGTGDDLLDGGANVDSCDGQGGTDTAVDCESVSGVP